MSNFNSKVEKIETVFKDYCDDKNYQIDKSEKANNIRLVISNLSYRTIVNIFTTGRIQVQGKESSLKEEIEAFKIQFEKHPEIYINGEPIKIKACTTTYDILLPELRTEIKKSLNTIGDTIEIFDNPKSTTEYLAKIKRNSSSLTLTQFNNGTLLLQGKTDGVFHECCEHIEKIANPAEKEVISRFISGNEESVELFAEKYSPRLIERAEKIVRDKIGDAYDYLEIYDQKYLVASECLCLTEIPLPEYSPYVMPSSKSFEGFCKKLLVDIELFEPNHFKSKKAGFGNLTDKNNTKRKSVCDKEKYADTMLNKISVCLDMYRNFMMHSDDNQITKVDNPNDAKKLVDEIFEDISRFFEYFNNNFQLSSD